MAGRAGIWTFRSVLANSPLRLRRSFCRSRCPTSTSTLSRPTTSCGCGAFTAYTFILADRQPQQRRSQDASNGARTIIVETASRFARDLMVQEVGFAKLQALGIKLVAADSPHSFLDDTPTSKLIRQILGAVSEFDKAMVSAKLKG